MVKLNKIYTRTGDSGQTGLGDGSRRLKTDARVVAYGTVDELNATIGLALASLTSLSNDNLEKMCNILLQIQNDLFDLGADLCVPENAKNRESRLRITADYVERLEQIIDHYNQDLAPLNSFILPGGRPEAAALHLARTVARRAERDCLALQQQEPYNTLCLTYLNRLSDLLFILARSSNDQGREDVLWQPGKQA